jgi:predicted DNA-binding mobile mystery protein A
MGVMGSAARRHIERRVGKLRPARQFAQPQRGWIRAVRDALGMSAAKLAERMNVSQPRVFALEKAEARGAVTIASLERAAQAMECTLVYALVPNRPIDEMLQKRALRIVTEELARVQHTMRLENQGMSAAELKAERRRLAADLIREYPRRLWD